MANFLNYLNRPEYLFQPEAVLRRFFPSSRVQEGLQIVHLNWGLPMQVDTREAIGILISRTGIFEISVVEAIFRLTDPATYSLTSVRTLV